jgi:hypothetical protein
MKKKLCQKLIQLFVNHDDRNFYQKCGGFSPILYKTLEDLFIFECTNNIDYFTLQS